MRGYEGEQEREKRGCMKNWNRSVSVLKSYVSCRFWCFKFVLNLVFHYSLSFFTCFRFFVFSIFVIFVYSAGSILLRFCFPIRFFFIFIFLPLICINCDCAAHVCVLLWLFVFWCVTGRTKWMCAWGNLPPHP